MHRFECSQCFTIDDNIQKFESDRLATEQLAIVKVLQTATLKAGWITCLNYC
jgi:hypothetical protein